MNKLQLSLFRGVHDTLPRPVTLDELVTMMRTDQSVRDLTEKHRYALSVDDKQGAKRYKHMMTSFGVAATFEGGRQQRHIVEFTGLSLVDIDHIEPNDMERVLSLVHQDPHTLLTYTTMSGQGLRVLFRYETPSNNSQARLLGEAKASVVATDALASAMGSTQASLQNNLQEHPEGAPHRGRAVQRTEGVCSGETTLYKLAFLHGNRYYSELVGLPTDHQCKNVGRISTIAYDEQLYYNPEATPFTIQAEEKQPIGRPKSVKSEKARVKSDQLADMAAAALAKVEAQGIRYEPGTYNKYVSTACYEMNRLGVPEEQCCEWAVSHFDDYDTPEVEAIVRSCYTHTDEHATRQPHTPKKKGESAMGDVRDIRRYFDEHGIQSRYNVITRKYEIYDESTGLWYENTDRMESTLYCSITDAIGKRILKSDLHNLLVSKFSPDYNPLAHYLDMLSPLEEDDTTDYIDLVASMVHVAKADEAKHRQWFKKWFVAMLATWLEPKVTNHVILTYIGPQGIYKSTFMRRLMPPALDSYFAVRNYASRMDKDDRLMLAEKGLVALEEIDSLTPRELNQLKAIVTAEAIDERDSYERNRERRVHIASFCATGNNRRFLTDLTGNRRWLPFFVTDIDSPYTHPIPYDQLYAQAYKLYREGFHYWFDPTEVAQLEEHNRNFEEVSHEEELILTYLRRPHAGESCEFVTSTRIIELIGQYLRTKLSTRKINRIMERLGFEYRKSNGLRGWNVIILTGDDIKRNQRLNALGSTPESDEDAL